MAPKRRLELALPAPDRRRPLGRRDKETVSRQPRVGAVHPNPARTARRDCNHLPETISKRPIMIPPAALLAPLGATDSSEPPFASANRSAPSRRLEMAATGGQTRPAPVLARGPPLFAPNFRRLERAPQIGPHQQVALATRRATGQRPPIASRPTTMINYQGTPPHTVATGDRRGRRELCNEARAVRSDVSPLVAPPVTT